MTVVVAVIPPESQFKLSERDIQVFTTKDTGAGGQHRNKTESCVIMRHVPTGIEAKAAARCQHQNRRSARALLEARVKAHHDQALMNDRTEYRRDARGSGMRGDKVRTYREKDDTVIDHLRDKKIRLCDIRAGKLDFLWK